MSCLSGEHNRELAVLAVTVAQILSQGRSAQESARLATFFTILGDTLALFALGPEECAPSVTACAVPPSPKGEANNKCQ